MGYIIKKMIEQLPEILLRLNIFLPAVLAVAALDHGSAVKAVLFGSFPTVGHVNFLLK